MSSATVRVAPDLIKALAILSETNIKWSSDDQSSYILMTSFPKILLITKRILTGPTGPHSPEANHCAITISTWESMGAL